MSEQKARNNRQIVREINQPAQPNAGARQVAGKDSTDAADTSRDGKQPKPEKVRVAVEDDGAARRAVNKQIGETGIPVSKTE